jgi:hypothetical protein
LYSHAVFGVIFGKNKNDENTTLRSGKCLVCVVEIILDELHTCTQCCSVADVF